MQMVPTDTYKNTEKRAEANSGAQQRVNTVNNFFFNQVKRATQLLQWNKEMKK